MAKKVNQRDKELNSVKYEFSNEPNSMVKEIVALRKTLVKNNLAYFDHRGIFRIH